MTPTSATTANEFAQHVARLREMPEHENTLLRRLFFQRGRIVTARAPGRLDVMGGIADYSGSLVLELPIAEAAFVAVQKSNQGDVLISTLGGSERTPGMEIIDPKEW